MKALKIWEEAPFPYPQAPIEWQEVGSESATFVWSEFEGVRIVATVCARGDGLEIGSISFAGDAIDSRLFRAVSLPYIRTAAIAQLRALWAFQAYQNVIRQRYREDVVRDDLLELGHRAIATKSSRRSVKTKMPEDDEQLYQVVEEYARIVEKDGHRGSHQRLATSLTKLWRSQVSRGMASQLVFRARKRGFLAPTIQGRASAAFGEAFYIYKPQSKSKREKAS
ncbi:MAG TPA: hypothetical protein VNE42_00160 [Acidimicrobiales bacterium]|nr:hypothetical protein [Acidimicrobiales bacterium]